ncbi:MAG: hypothetical protein ACRC6V_06700 [Bacteroidales bacterium]
MPINVALTALQASIGKIEDNTNIPDEIRQEIAQNVANLQEEATAFHENVNGVLSELEGVMDLDLDDVNLDNTLGTMSEGLEEILQNITKAFEVTV